MTIFMEPADADRFDIAAVYASLAARYQTVVTAPDSFSAERTKITLAAEELKAEGAPLSNIDFMLASVDSKEKAFGPGMNVRVISASGVRFEGRIRAGDLMLKSTGNDQQSRQDAEEIARSLVVFSSQITVCES